MISTRQGPVPVFLGADLTDRYAGRGKPRPIAVCGLDPIPVGWKARFWTWEWDPPGEPLELEPIAEEIRGALGTMLDAPQGLALRGRKMREADRQCRAAGKVPDAMSKLRGPYSGFVRSSLEVLAGLHVLGVPVFGPDFRGGAGEVYPGYFWAQFGDLPKKTTIAGREARVELLELLGVQVPPTILPSHDDLDACSGAIVAAVAGGALPGLEIGAVGDPLVLDASGVLREGRILCVAPGDRLRPRLRRRAQGREPGQRRNKPLPRHGGPRIKVQRVYIPKPDELPALGPGSLAHRAGEMLQWLVERATSGDPLLLTYKTAYEMLFGDVPGPWSVAYAHQVIAVAVRTRTRRIRGLGRVALDSFIVNQSNRRPGAGHWDRAVYDEPAWRKVFDGAPLWHRSRT